MFRSFAVQAVAILQVALVAAACGPGREELLQGHLARGDEYLAKKQHQEAIVEYRNAVRQDEQSGDVRFKLATAYEAAGDPRGAIREFVRAADLLPEDADAQIKAANYLLLAGQFEDAQSRVQRVLDRNPKHIEALIVRANALAGVRDLDGAITQIQEAIALDPERAPSYTNLAQVKLAQGKRDEARAGFEKAVELDPSSVPARLALANFQWAVGEIAGAEQTLQRLLETQPDHVLANRALATLYLTTQRAAAAERHLKRIAEGASVPGPRFSLADYYVLMQRPDDARSILKPMVDDRRTYSGAQSRLAQLEYQAGRTSQAHAMIDEVLGKEAKNVDVLLIKARWLLAEGKSGDARKYAQTAVQSDASSVGAHFLFGTVQAAQHDGEGAANSFREVLRLNPRAVPAQLALTQLELHDGRVDSAMGFAEGAVEQSPNSPIVRLNLARALVAQGESKRAESEIRALLMQYPGAASVHAVEGALRLSYRDLGKARTSFQRALELNPRLIEALNGLTAIDLQERRSADARARIEGQLANDPDRVELLQLAARVYMADRDAANAEKVLLRAIQLAPAQMDGYKMLARVYLAQRKLDVARKEFDQLARRDPKDVTARTMGALIVHAQNDVAEARKRYEEIVEMDGKAAVALNNLAWIYADEKIDLDRALYLAQRAAQLLPKSAEVQDTLGWVYHQKELPALAIAPFQRSTELDPGNASYHYHLGLAYLKSGEREKARSALQQALKLDPASPQAGDVRKALASLQG